MNLYHQISEKVFTKQVIDLARWYKWLVAHFRPGMDRRGKWQTAVQGDGAGFPDLVMVRPPRIIFAELKSARGKLTKDQAVWLESLRRSDVEQYEWRPEQIAEIERILK